MPAEATPEKNHLQQAQAMHHSDVLLDALASAEIVNLLKCLPLAERKTTRDMVVEQNGKVAC